MTALYVAPARVNPVLAHPAERRITLSGAWRFRLDPDDVGLRERWYADLNCLPDEIGVPGSWQGQGFGSDAKDTVWDFRLDARTFRATYQGTGWYGRAFGLPAGWQGSRIWLYFGGVFPSAEVWLNGVRLGEHHAPFVPFALDVTDIVTDSAANWVVVRVYEQGRELGLSFGWQGPWSGLYRDVELVATGSSFLERLWARPEGQEIKVIARVGGPAAGSEGLVLQVAVSPIGQPGEPIRAEIPVTSAEVLLSLQVPAPRLWSPEAPNLYRVDATLVQRGRVVDAASERVGFVTLGTAGKHFTINGEPYYMRGTGEFLSNPETGCPDTSRERWRKKLAALRAYGYNYVRCQSFVPAPEYFDVADEVGLLIQAEAGTLGGWGGSIHWHVYQWPQPTSDWRELLMWQWNRVVMRDVNHPSANLYCMSNELGASTNFPRVAWQCYNETKAIKPSAMVIWTDGGYSETLPGDFVNAEADMDGKCAKPVIQHEFRWWSSFPDVRIMSKYSGAVRPYGAEIAIEAATRHGISHILPKAAEMSQRLQLLEAKGKMENCRRDNPKLAGICHFNAMDANPSPQGVIDEFYDDKVTTAAGWCQTNGDTVILASLGFDDRNLAAGDLLRVKLSVSDFSHPAFSQPVVSWRLVAGAETLAAGQGSYAHQPFCTCEALSLEVRVPAQAAPRKAVLHATLSEGGCEVSNRWDLWLFPAQQALPATLFRYQEGASTPDAAAHTWLRTTSLPLASAADLADVSRVRAVAAERLDEGLLAYARAGGRVILAASEALLRPYRPKFGMPLGHYYFTPPANYPPYEDGHDGTIITPSPMLGELPHEGFADLQFFRLITNAAPLDLEPLGLSIGDPVVRAIHSYPVCHPVGYLAEFKLGQGGIIIDALNLDQAWPEARYLLSQIASYAVSDDFGPSAPLTPEAVVQLLAATAVP